MYTRKGAMLCIVVLTLLISSSTLIASAQTFKVSVTPPTMSVNLGEEVTVNVTVANAPAPGIYSYQLKLTYNSALLNATKAEVPSDHMLKPTNPAKIFLVDPGTIDQTAGQVSFALTLLGDEVGKTGGGRLVTVGLKGLANGVSTLGIAELILVDGDGNQIPEASYTVEPGSATIIPEFSTALLIAIFAIMSVAAIAFKKKLQ